MTEEKTYLLFIFIYLFILLLSLSFLNIDLFKFFISLEKQVDMWGTHENGYRNNFEREVMEMVQIRPL
jgi:hypothetical protein